MNLFLHSRKFSSLLLLATIALSGLITTVNPEPSVAQAARQQSTSEVAKNRAIADLAAHLKKVGAKMYGAYWCPHCTRQKEMFGTVFQSIDYVECDPRGENPRPKLCREAGIKGYPTWEINGKQFVGVQSFEELAEASNFKGSRKF